MAVEEDLGYIQPIDEAVLFVKSDRPAPSQMLEAGHPSVALQTGGFVQHYSNASALRDNGLSNLLLVRLSLRGKGEHGDVPDNVEAIREPTETFIRHYPPQVFFQMRSSSPPPSFRQGAWKLMELSLAYSSFLLASGISVLRGARAACNLYHLGPGNEDVGYDGIAMLRFPSHSSSRLSQLKVSLAKPFPCG